MTGGPRRTCIACREVRTKHELVRLVRSPEGVVVIDDRGRAPGRGAYVCRGGECATRLAKGGRLSQAFRLPTRVEPAPFAAARPIERLEAAGAARTEGRSMGTSTTSSRR